MIRLNAEERQTVIDGLINGECCFEESERDVLNSLSDRTLARLTRNARLTFNGENAEEEPLPLPPSL